MKIAIIKNNTLVKAGEHTELFPDVSFPVTGIPEDFMRENSIQLVIEWLPLDMYTQKLIPAEPYLKDNKVYSVAIVNKSAEELAQDIQAMEIDVRNERNSLLASSDWTQVADAPVDKEAWATYRQELRDITSQTGFPDNVAFPSPPN
jgi:hypothetical protein